MDFRNEGSKMIKAIYISHPCTSFGDIEENRKIAKKHADYFKSKGFHVLNPLDIINPKSSYNEAMRMSFEMLQMCDIIVMCGDWQRSRGCRAEYEYALENGLAAINMEIFENND